MCLISDDLIQELVDLNNKILDKTVTHPARLALALEEITAIAWSEAQKNGTISWHEAEDLAPSMRIDP